MASYQTTAPGSSLCFLSGFKKIVSAPHCIHLLIHSFGQVLKISLSFNFHFFKKWMIIILHKVLVYHIFHKLLNAYSVLGTTLDARDFPWWMKKDHSSMEFTI